MGGNQNPSPLCIVLAVAIKIITNTAPGYVACTRLNWHSCYAIMWEPKCTSITAICAHLARDTKPFTNGWCDLGFTLCALTRISLVEVWRAAVIMGSLRYPRLICIRVSPTNC